jgi:acetyl esterase/lipase
MRAQIRLVKPILKRLSINTARAFQDNLGDIQARSLLSKIVFVPVEFDQFEACMAIPKGKPRGSDSVILYLHGGGYVAGSIGYARGFASLLAVETNRQVLAVAYRLAPEHPFPAALDDVLSAYMYLLDAGYKHISFVGESAGGGLIFALYLKLKEMGLPYPESLVGISPWTDLAFSGESHKSNSKKDPSLSENALRSYAAVYAKGQEENPFVSPVYGDFTGMPRSLIIVGSFELLLDDARMLAARLQRDGCNCEIIVEEGLWHVYVLFKIPEARKALNKIAAFLEI